MNIFSNSLNKYRNFNICEKIIIVNVIFFVVPFFIRSIFFLFQIPISSYLTFLKLSPQFSILFFRPWTIISYSFVHAGVSHIIWNMLLLFFASKYFLNLFSEQKYINTYFLGVISGGFVFLISYSFFPVFNGVESNLIGSSAGVMAVIIFICTYTPYQEIRLLFVNIRMLYIAIFIVIINLIQIPSGNAGGNLAHLGGAFFGYLYAFNLKKGNDLGYGFEKTWKIVINIFSFDKKSDKIKKNRLKSKSINDSKQKKIDNILDKINKSGYDSLTSEEKDYLFKAGK